MESVGVMSNLLEQDGELSIVMMYGHEGNVGHLGTARLCGGEVYVAPWAQRAAATRVV